MKCSIDDGINEIFSCFFFNDTATTEIYTLSLHDALPISRNFYFYGSRIAQVNIGVIFICVLEIPNDAHTTLRSEEHTSELQSPVPISYAVFCLKKKIKLKK